MRSIWKGAISFGLVTIPVRLYSATEERNVSFNQVHAEDGGRIKYQRVCSVDGEQVSYGDIAKGYQLPTGEMVVLTDQDLADLPLTSSRAIDVLQFVPAGQVDPIYFAKSYYLEPEAAGTRPYVLLRDALAGSDQVALVKIALRQRESLATLRVRDGVFVLEMMLWPDEIRTPDFGFLDEDVEVRPQELAMARSLIETLTGDFQPEQYADGYREALQALIDAKVAGREVVEPAEPTESGGTVVDLMAALRASVAAARGEAERAAGVAVRDEESGGPAPDAEPSPGARRRTTRTPAATKVAAKKAPAKKAAATKAPAEAEPAARSKTPGKTAARATTRARAAVEPAPAEAPEGKPAKRARRSA